MAIRYGKIITTYFDGKPTDKIQYSIPVLITDKSQCLGEIIKAIDLIISRQTHSVNLIIKADKDYKLKSITSEYIVNKGE